ncbi:hypothetical protein D3C81_2108190 [compost metagenome]
MRWPTSWQGISVPCTLTRMTRSNSASPSASALPLETTPATLTSAVISPSSRSTSSTTAATAAREDTSQARNQAPAGSAAGSVRSSAATR